MAKRVQQWKKKVTLTIGGVSTVLSGTVRRTPQAMSAVLPSSGETYTQSLPGVYFTHRCAPR